MHLELKGSPQRKKVRRKRSIFERGRLRSSDAAPGRLMIGPEQLKSTEAHLFDARDPSMEGQLGPSERWVSFRGKPTARSNSVTDTAL